MMKPNLATLSLSAALSGFVYFSGSAIGGSLWIGERNIEQSMFADKRAKNIGDILTVVVQENTTMNLANELQTFDGVQGGFGVFVNNLISQFVGAIPSFLNNQSPAQVAANAAANAAATTSTGGVTIPTLDVASNGQFTGGGSITNRQAISNRTAVTVVDVLPNGNMVIEGAKIVRSGQQTMYASLRGIVRPEDVEQDNTVLSTNIADAQVDFIPEGELTEAEKKGWLLRFYDRIKPF